MLMKSLTSILKFSLGAVMLLFLFSYSECEEKEENDGNTQKYNHYVPIYKTIEEFTDSIFFTSPKEIVETGKIYFYNDYLFIGQPKKGVHIFDLSKGGDPINIKYLNIPGNVDITIKNGIVYADVYNALVTFKIDDALEEVTLIDIDKEVFEYPYDLIYEGQNHDVDSSNFLYNYYDYENVRYDSAIIVGWKYIGLLEREENYPDYEDGVVFAESTADAGSVGLAKTGTSGSLARFMLVDDFLYVLNSSQMKLFEIKEEKPLYWSTVNIGWNIETIYRLDDNLFIGSTTGMFIYDISIRSNPKWVSEVQHFRSCDPVVADADYAYVTLRGGGICGAANNELQIIDIKDIKNPKVVARVSMAGPYGLGVKDKYVYVCDGRSGLKGVDVSNQTIIDEDKLEAQILLRDIDPRDLIIIGNTAYILTVDGFLLYEIASPEQLEEKGKLLY